MNVILAPGEDKQMYNILEDFLSYQTLKIKRGYTLNHEEQNTMTLAIKLQKEFINMWAIDSQYKED